jgi:hypothetical protein
MPNLAIEQARERVKGLTFEEFFMSLLELRESHKKTEEILKESQRKADEQWLETKKYIQETSERMRITDELLKESQRKTDEQLRETAEQLRETDEILKESQRKTDEQIRRMNKQIGGQGAALGALTEALFASNLYEKFPKEYDLRQTFRNMPIYNEKSSVVGEVDILLVNTEWAAVVEVKSEPVESDIEHHEKRMNLLKKYPIAQIIGKKLIAAIACGYAPDNVRDKAHKAGFYVLALNGEQVDMLEPEIDFKAREW